MKFIDIAFGATLVAFGLGSLAGAALTAYSFTFRGFLLLLVNSRVVAPVRAATALGGIAVMLLIFLNNCVPVALSFLYPWIIGKFRWEPPLRKATANRLLMACSLLTGSLVGFFSLGATLMLVEELRGPAVVSRFLVTSVVHGPMEFLFVLLCVAEPLRLGLRNVDRERFVELLRADLNLLFICLIGLLASAAIEVFAGL
jgi:hypothetical protein